MGNILKRPPFTGATAQISFSGSDSVDFDTIYRNITEELKDIFSVSESISNQILTFDESGSLKGEVKKLPRLSTADGKTQVTINERILSVERLPPYTNWTDYKTDILTSIQAYVKHAYVTGVNKIALRYINEVRTDLGRHDSDFFKIYLENKSDFPVKAFVFNAELVPVSENMKTTVRISQKADVLNESNEKIYLFDINHQIRQDMSMDSRLVEQVLEGAHDTVEDIFLKLPTQSTIESFNQ